MNQKNKKINEIIESLKTSRVNNINLVTEVRQSFLDYSMSVITARALPDVRDGLKPVHRRILYSAFIEGLTSDKRFKKSAALVGFVMGSFHPHGDGAIYESLVRLAQDFNMRYPLIEGQGNFGSIDGDSAAAMRYTESRLSKLGDLFLDDIKEDTVDFIPNYDGSKKEPTVLPSSVPNILINGTTGIAVGLATNIPPHNLTEICNGIIAFLENPDLSYDELFEYIKGPDFPTGGEILETEGVFEYMKTGRGGFYNRSKVEVHDTEKEKYLIVREIPYAVNKTRLIERIVALAKPPKGKEGVLDIMNAITDIRDESNREGIRLIIELKSSCNPYLVLNLLHKHSPLQERFSTNFTVLVNREPKVLGILDILKLYVQHQLDVLLRKTKFNLQKVIDRIHILEGRKIIADDILNVVKIIAEENEPEEKLKTIYQLSQIQVEDIINQPLRSIKKIERAKLVEDLKQLNLTKLDYEETLVDEVKQKNIIAARVKNIRDKFGDKRRTIINHDLKGIIDRESLINVEDVVITLSQKGYIKQTPIRKFKAHKRGGVGVKGSSTYEDDNVIMLTTCSSHDYLLFFSNKGRVYRTKVYELPEGDRTSKGRPIVQIFSRLGKDEKILTILPIKEFNEGSLLFATKRGLVKKISVEQFSNINVAGKIALLLREGDELKFVLKISDESEILLASSNGNIIKFKSSILRNQGRNSSGVKGIKLLESEVLISASSSDSGSLVFSIGENGFGKVSEMSSFRLTNRGSKGTIGLKVNEKTGKMLMAIAVNGTEEILLMTNTNKINRFSIANFLVIGRKTSGVRLFKTTEKEYLVYATKYLGSNDDLETEENSDFENTKNPVEE